MATVRSLEERIDDLAEDLTAVKTKVELIAHSVGSVQSQSAMINAQLATLASNLATTQAQLSAVAARLDGLNEKLSTLTSKLESLLIEHTALKVRWEATDQRVKEAADKTTELNEFRAKAEQTFALMRWIGAFAAASLLAVCGAAFTVVRSTLSVESKLEQQQKSLDEIKRDVNELRRDVNEIKGKPK